MYGQDLISFATLSFGTLQGVSVDDVVLVAKIPGLSDTEPVEISPKLWPTVSRMVDNVMIILESGMSTCFISDRLDFFLERHRSSRTICKSSDSLALPQKARPSQGALDWHPNLPTSSSPHQQRPPLNNLQACQASSNSLQQTLPLPVGLPRLQNHGSATFGPQTINVIFISQSIFQSAPPPFSINEDGLLGQKVSYLSRRIQTRVFGNLVISNLRIASLSLDKERTLSSYAMYSGSTVTAILAMKQLLVCQPVIYLYPPSSLADVTVELDLVPSWLFSAVHPSQGNAYSLRKQCWKVAAEPNGTLVDKTTGMEVSYLYWKAM